MKPINRRALGTALGAAFGVTFFNWLHGAKHRTPVQITVQFAEGFPVAFLTVVLLELWRSYRNRSNSR